MFKIIPVIISALTFVIFIRFMMKKGDNGYDKAVDEFMDRELKANNTIKNFENLNIEYVKPSKNLPFKDYEETPENKMIIKKQKLVKRKIDLEMIKIPSNLTNTQIKEMYGVNNFDRISMLEDHFNSYVRALYEWAFELYNINNIYDCKKILEEAYRLEANISQVYILLANIYFKENDKSKLIKLKNHIENIELSLKEKALEQIEKYL